MIRNGLLPGMLILLLGFGEASAETSDLTIGYGYQWGGGLTVTRGRLEIDNAPQFNITFDYPMRQGVKFEAYLCRQSTHLTAVIEDVLPDTLERDSFGLDIWYWHVGGVYELRVGEPVRPYGVVTVGGTTLAPTESGINTNNLFSVGLGGGIKAFFTDHFGLRLDGRGIISFIYATGDLFCGTPAGCYESIGGETFTQGQLSIGAMFAY